MKKIILILFCMIFVLQNAIYAQEAGKISASLGFDDQSDMNALAPDEAEIFKKRNRRALKCRRRCTETVGDG